MEKPLDMMRLLTWIAHGIVFVKFLLSGVTIGAVNFGLVDAAVVMAILGATTGGYVARRYTTAKFESVDVKTATVGASADLRTEKEAS